MPVGSVLSFPENSFMPVGSVFSFPEKLIFPVPCKGISFIPLVFALVLCVTVLIPPHGFTSIDELKNTGIVFRQSKTLVEV